MILKETPVNPRTKKYQQSPILKDDPLLLFSWICQEELQKLCIKKNLQFKKKTKKI